jgi:hypothetical protein
VEPASGSIVRLDVRDLVRQWARHDDRDQGIAISADKDTRNGTTFALSGVGADRGSSGDVRDGMWARSGPAAPDVEPYLELYVR